MNDEKKQEQWEKWRAAGFFRFFLKVGILAFAFPVTLIVQIYNYISRYGLTSSGFPEFFTFRLLIEFFVFMILQGLIFGTLIWFYSERKYPRIAGGTSSRVGPQ